MHSFNRPFVFTGDVLPPNSSCSFRFFNMFLYVSVSFDWSLQYIQCLISRSLAHPESWKSYMFLSVWHRCPQAPVTGFFHFWAPNLTTAHNCPAKTKLGLNLVSRVESPAFQFYSGVNPVVFPPHQLRSHLVWVDHLCDGSLCQVYLLGPGPSRRRQKIISKDILKI